MKRLIKKDFINSRKREDICFLSFFNNFSFLNPNQSFGFFISKFVNAPVFTRPGLISENTLNFNSPPVDEVKTVKFCEQRFGE